MPTLAPHVFLEDFFGPQALKINFRDQVEEWQIKFVLI